MHFFHPHPFWGGTENPHPLHSGLGKEGGGKRTKTPEAPVRRTGLAGKKVENQVRFLRCLCPQPRLLTLSLGAVPTLRQAQSWGTSSPPTS